MWTSSSNSGEQITGESQKNSCAGNRERDVGERDKQCEGGITGINVRERETAELFITKIINENKLKENSVTSERLRCEIG